MIARDVEIALRAGAAGPIGQRLVGQLDMQRSAVGLGIDRDRGDAHPPRGADHAAGDLAAIGDQDFARTPAHIRKTPKRPGRSPSNRSIGALRLAEIANARAMRVSAGSMTPSSQSRALA